MTRKRLSLSLNKVEVMQHVFPAFVCLITSLQGEIFLEAPADFKKRIDIAACFLEAEGEFLFLASNG